MSRGLRLGGHPLHAMLTDVPIGLLAPSLLWDALGLWRGETVWWAISFWTIALGVASAVLAAIAGFIDFVALQPDDNASRHGIAHMMLMLTAVCAYATSLAVRGGAGVPMGGARWGVLAAEAFGLATLGAGGWFGGHLVFRHGLGRERVDEADNP